jgi:hypothetical protein
MLIACDAPEARDPALLAKLDAVAGRLLSR